VHTHLKQKGLEIKMDNCDLHHHGILGMKWGVRRFQSKSGRLTSAGKERYTDDAAKGERKKGLTDKQKKAIKIGAAVAATALVAYGAYRLGKSGKLDRFINAGKQQANSLLRKDAGLVRVQGFQSFQKLKQKETISEAISKVNASGSRNNCYNVVVGTVGRLCGLDVVAKGDTQSGKGLSFDEVCKVFKLDPNSERDVRRIMSPTVDRITSQVGKRFTEGDVGAVGLEWNDKYKNPRGLRSAGHTLNWIIKNGKVEFVDGQTGASGETLKKIMETFLDSGHEVALAKFANVAKGLDLENGVVPELLRKFVE
jgi:hypothetical protein